MDFLVDYMNDNLEDIYMSKIENEKDRELRDYCIRSLAEKKSKSKTGFVNFFICDFNSP